MMTMADDNDGTKTIVTMMTITATKTTTKAVGLLDKKVEGNKVTLKYFVKCQSLEAITGSLPNVRLLKAA